MKSKRHSPIHGLRDVGQFKLYEKRLADKVEILVSKHFNNKIQRVKITRADAIKLQGLPKTNFAEECQQRLEGAKRAGSPNYFEN
jgi:hypothetical protein